MTNYIYKDENAIYYECGYSCDNAIFLSLENEKIFITDSRYEIDVAENTKDLNVVIAGDLLLKLCDILKTSKIKQLSVNTREWSYAQVSKIQELDIELEFVENMSQKKRIIKDDKEIQFLKQAVKLGADGFDRFANYVQHNGLLKNEQELALNNFICMSNNGKLATSFDAIVAINENSAKPHAHPSDKILNQGDVLLVDAGIKYKRYCSDRTRTVEVQEEFKFDYIQKFIDKKKQNIYDTVQKAHDKCIEDYRVGMRACDVDKIARDIIGEAGYGEFFVHSTGHGVGLDIHELPFISRKDTTLIEENMIFTIEPGIYIKDFMGVRVEDMVVVQKGKLVVL